VELKPSERERFKNRKLKEIAKILHFIRIEKTTLNNLEQFEEFYKWTI